MIIECSLIYTVIKIKLFVSVLAEDAIKAALSDYRIKQQSVKNKDEQAT